MCSFILLIALFTVLGSGYDISKLPVGVAEQSYDESIGKGYNIDMDGLPGNSNLPYYGRPTNCTWRDGQAVGSCDCPNEQSNFLLHSPSGKTGYAICAKPCDQASECPPAPDSASVDVKCVLFRCLLDCSGFFDRCTQEDYSVCMNYHMGEETGTMCLWIL
ncbi:hypothetical protein Pmar_PMAR024887 [Perkinsus marinus ATCC 50983]|uniref:Uncharacterized protein n=1 Tax=Perkinsus marinus (strain ATCC 50983 / TXsc) TaxID=423536 RepID=C5LCX1_PERM5|nr:hypothetical protein Pmar_PMAR024887 [Perkinsus marinus ATCC 50983]EER05424.1 hypothetical protein Pmar_PMAR024887 [Perkinsus marinus ATCC 50983]|eukprot:XP_002773608.1 hypothetical protein Pmar_PMAR024887 [Perkinsus marinus ATCC 50983]